MLIHPAAVGLFAATHAAFENRDDGLHGCLDQWLDDLPAADLRMIVETLLLMLQAITDDTDVDLPSWLRRLGLTAAVETP